VDRAEDGKYLLSITGLNYIGVAGMLAELGSFRSSRSAKHLIKMAGSNPTDLESAGKGGNYAPSKYQEIDHHANHYSSANYSTK